MGRKITVKCTQQCIDGKLVEICVDPNTEKVVTKKIIGDC